MSKPSVNDPSVRKGTLLAIAVGVLIAAAHLILGLAGVLTSGQWISGVAIGLVVAGVGNHIRIYLRR